MSLFSGRTDKVKERDQKLLGLEEIQGTTDQEGRPVPVMWGTQRLGVTLLTQRFDLTHKTHSSKKSGEYREYFCSFAGLLCHGPLERLDKIIVDRAEVWPAGGDPATRDLTRDKVCQIRVVAGGSGYSAATTVTLSGGATARPIIRDGVLIDVIVTAQGSGYNPASPPAVTVADGPGGGTGASCQAVIDAETYREISIEDYGTVRFYWGSPYQEFDPTLLRLSEDTGRNPDGLDPDNAAEEHPAYLGQSYFVARAWRLGNNRTTIPNLEFVVARYPAVSWMTSAANMDSDCNPVVLLADAMTNSRYGLGLDSSLIDSDQFDAVAGSLVGENLGLSPIVNRTEEFETFVVRLLEYIQGYHTTTAAGLFRLGLIRNPGCTVGDPLTPYYDEDSLTEPPKVKAISWDETRNQIFVTFTNRDLLYKVQSVTASNLPNWKLTNEPRPMTLERPWITKMGVADAYARVAAQVEGLPRQTGLIRIRESRLDGLDIGDIFKLSWNHWSMCYMFCRCTEIRWPDPYAREVEIEFERDRGYFAEQIIANPAYQVPAKQVREPAVPYGFRIIEMPFDKRLTGEPYLAALVSRQGSLAGSFVIWLTDPDLTAAVVLRSRSFSYHAKVSTEYPVSSDGTMSVIADGGDTILPSSVDGLNPAANEWLLFCGNEIMSVGTATLIDAETKQYDLTVLRERFDSPRETHPVDQECYLISLDNLSQAVFQTGKPSGSGDTATVTVQMSLLGRTVPLADSPDQTVTWTDRAKRWWKPRNMQVNGTRWYADPGPIWSTGQDVSVTWQLNNPYGDGGSNGWLGGFNGWPDMMADLWFLEVRDAGDNLVDTLSFAPTTTSTTLTNSYLQGVLGIETTFKLKISARQVQDGVTVESAWYDQATVTFQ